MERINSIINMHKKIILLLFFICICTFLGFGRSEATITFSEIGDYQLCSNNSVSIGMKANNQYLKSFTQKCAKILINNVETTYGGDFLVSEDFTSNNYNCPFYSFFAGYDGSNLHCKYLLEDNNQKISWNNYYLRNFVIGSDLNIKTNCDDGSVQVGINGQKNIDQLYGLLKPLNGINCSNGIKTSDDSVDEKEYHFKLRDSRCEGDIQVNEFEVDPLPGSLFYYLIVRPEIGSDDYQYEVNYQNKIIWKSNGPMSKWYEDTNQLYFEVTGFANNHFVWAKSLYNDLFPNVNVVNTYKNYYGLKVPKLNCHPAPSPSITPTIDGIKGIFISKKVNFLSSNNMVVKFDNNVVKNSPPGFNELLAPIWKEFTP